MIWTLWLTLAAAETLGEAFPPPAGATRVDGGAYGAWLRELPLEAPGHPVHDYTGAVQPMRAARVVAWSVEGQSALQCADTALRLRATWERSVGRSPAFHYTSGDLSRWHDWAAGARPTVSGSKVTWVPGAARPDKGEATFQRWLTNLYTYAGTRSIPRDTTAVDTPRPGDMLVEPGSPGHLVVLLDVASAGDRTWVLVGQGFMPAMELHVLAGPAAGWFPVEGDTLPAYPIPMAWSGLRRWTEPR